MNDFLQAGHRLQVRAAPLSRSWPRAWASCRPQIQQINSAEQTRRRLGQQDLTAVPGGHHPRRRLSTAPKYPPGNSASPVAIPIRTGN